jgi:hypothetical protein
LARATLGAVPDVIPPALWARLRAFLATGATGQVVLHVRAGVVTRLELCEVVRVKADLDTIVTGR